MKFNWLAVGLGVALLVGWAGLGWVAETVFAQNATIATSADQTLVASSRDVVWLLRVIALLLVPMATKFSLELISRK